MISRNYQKLVWQCIKWHNIIKYIDTLKSRIYEAFLYRYMPEVYKQQSIFIISPLVITWAFKKIILSNSVFLNSFEIGYCIFCLSRINVLDISFFDYYTEDCSIDRISAITTFIRKIKHLIIIWSLEPYYNYLLYLNNISNIQFYNLKSFNYRINDRFIYKYSVSFDLISYIPYLYLYVLLDKLYLNQSIKLYLFEFLDLGVFIDLIFYLDIYSSSSLFTKLLEIIILQLSYEISIMLSNFYTYRHSISKTIFINDKFSLVIFSKDNEEIKRIRKKFLNILLFNGIFIKKKPEIQNISLFNGFNLNGLFISNNYQVYPFNFMIRPSLYSQLLLMKQLSSILIQSISKPLFLLTIRLNMLLLLWSINYTVKLMSRIFYLLDYLIVIKFSVFIKKKKLNLHFCNLRIYNRDKIYINDNYEIEVFYKFIFVPLNNYEYFNYYILVKLFWLYRLKFSINLREAI